MSVRKITGVACLAVCAIIRTATKADALSDELRFCRLSPKCANSSAVTVFNELEELDDRADCQWRALPDRVAYDTYRRTMRERMIRAFGGLPARTPLNAKTVAVFRRNGYRIEKLIFESQPGLHVTANLFVPDLPSVAPPYPAVVMSCGHSDDGKDCATYLHACVLAVRAGFVALMFDPYAQGERRIPNSGLNCCQHHNQIGFRATLLGGSAAQLRIWDAIRAIDYVESRSEVDRNRIGYMGQSGGGTMTALMAAVDPRIKVAAPSCYLTSLTSLCEHMGPQDAEQNIFGQLTFGLNHTAYVLIPDIKVAITCKFSDMFTYYGTRKLFRAVESVAEKIGTSGHYMLNDAPGPHGWTESTESMSVAWMRAWLCGESDRIPFDKTEFRARDLGFDIAKDGELGLADEERGCIPTKRTADLPDERGIAAILRDRLYEAMARRPRLSRGAARASLVKGLARIKTADEAKVRVKELSQVQVDNFVVTHLAFLHPSGLALPAELVMLAGSTPKVVTVSVGRQGRANAFENVRAALTTERAVLVADLTGLGDVGRSPYVFYGRKDLPEEGTSAMLYLMGESMIGRRATDLLVLSAELRRRGFTDVSLVASEDVSIAAAHAFAAVPGAFIDVRLVDPVESWVRAFDAEHDGQTVLSYTTIVNGALMYYDWTELLQNE